MTEIQVREGDISQCEADALVNAANNYLWMGSGVAGALKRAGGQQIEDEAITQGPIRVGEVVATGAGRLKARYVIHAAVMGQDLRTSAVAVKEATENSLRCAEELNCRSIAYPALGTGVGGFSLEECARLMIDAVLKYISGKTGLERVIFILYGAPAYQIFKTELARQTK